MRGSIYLLSLVFLAAGCEDGAPQPTPISDEPARIRFDGLSDDVTVGSAQIRDVLSQIVIEWEPGISCESQGSSVGADELGLYVILPSSVVTGDELEIGSAQGEARVSVSTALDGGGFNTLTFSSGTVIVDSKDSDQIRIRMRATTGSGSVEGALTATICPN